MPLSEAPTTTAYAETGGNGAQPLIHIRDLVKNFSNAAGEVQVLKHIYADFYPGEFVGIIGKSGSGKSTLINMITGIDRPTSGEIMVAETPVHELNENELAIWRGKQLGIVFQFFQLLPMLSLVENVMLPMDFCHMYTARERKIRAMELLELMEMDEHATKLPTEISGGQQQRVAIARALANDPPILMADEPTGNLDSHTAEVIFGIFESLVQQGKTVIMVTHDSSLARRVNRTFLIHDGEIVNEYLARALPLLSAQQMLMATKQLEVLHYEPGATILSEGSRADNFYIVTKGRVEIALKRPGGGDVVVFRPGPGEYFGEVELLRGSQNIATARAVADAPVELVALDRSEFTALLADSEETRDALKQIAESRTAENIAAREEEEQQ
ncbi:MAG: ATP-binding cassette domain-containing protein [Anaerolineales bacterium]|jgi:ABC-type lipoprotein export system ATPase subunit